MKQALKKIFALFGIGIYRLNRELKDTAPSKAEPKTLLKTKDFAFQHNSLENVNRIFSDPVQMDEYLQPSRLKFYDEVLQLAISGGVDLNDKEIVDVGCGTGHLLLAIKKISKPLTITGLDFSAEAIKFSKKIQPEASFSVYDLYEKFENKFDVIFCTEVLEHLIHPEIAISNIKEMMRSNSVCFITVPNGRIDTFAGHINFWSPESWLKFISDQFRGYQIESGVFQDNAVNYSIVRKS